MALSFEQFQKLRGQGLTNDQIRRFESGEVPQTEQKTEEPGMIDRFTSSVKESGKSALESIKKRFSEASGELSSDFSKGEFSPVKAALRTGGAIAGSIGDVAGATIETGFKTIIPESTQKNIQGHVLDILKTPAGQAGLEALKAGEDVYSKFKEANPELAKSFEDIGNIFSVLPVGKGAQLAGKEAKAIAKDVISGVASVAKKDAAQAIESTVQKGIEKGIRPSVAGMKGEQDLVKYYKKASDAVVDIVKNKDNLNLLDEFGETVKGLPKSLNQFGQAITQRKEAIFKKYDELAKAAGQEGAKVDLSKIANELRNAANDVTLQDLDKNAVNFANKLADSLEARGAYTAEQAQDAIKKLNESLQAFYSGKSGGSSTKVALQAMIANNLREGLDTAITGIKGKGYQELKNAYGSLKQIEKDVAHRALVDARKNAKGLLDMSNVFTYGDIVMGLGSGNIDQVARGAVGKGISAYYKYLNNPNNTINRMFKNVEKYIQKGESKTFSPESSTGKLLQKTKGLPVGMSIKDVSGELGAQRDYIVNSMNNKWDDIIKAVNKGKIDFEDYGELKRIKDALEKGKETPVDIRKALETAKRAGVDLGYKAEIPGVVAGLEKKASPAVGKSSANKLNGPGMIIDGKKWKIIEQKGANGDKWLVQNDEGFQKIVPKSSGEFVKEIGSVESSTPSYAMSHRPTKTGGIGSDITNNGKVIPKDFYDHPEWYADMSDKTYQQSFSAIRKMRNNPDMEVTVYRASTKNELNNGDWITLSKDYAKGEARSDTKVYAHKVKAKDIQFAGDDINEFGYHPQKSFNPPTVGKTANKSLLEEAKKYKSAEEFVKAQGEPLYHGTNNTFEVFDPKKIGSQTDEGLYGRGFYFANSEPFARGAIYGRPAKNVMEVYPKSRNLFDISKIKSKQEMADLLDMSEHALSQDANGIIRPIISQSGQFASHVKDLGYDGIVIHRGGDAVETVIFDAKNLQTKSQLIRIWNKANKK